MNALDNFGRFPLNWPFREGYLEISKLLILNGANVNTKNNDNWTPLHYACRGRSNLEVTKLFLQNGADVNVCQCTSQTKWIDTIAFGMQELPFGLGGALAKSRGKYWRKVKPRAYTATCCIGEKIS